MKKNEKIGFIICILFCISLIIFTIKGLSPEPINSEPVIPKTTDAVVEIVEEVTSTEATLTMQNDNKISMSYVLGKEDTVTAIPVLGTILSIIESKWGYMFLVIFPTILIVVYEVFAIVTEIKKSDNSKSNSVKEEKEVIEEL
jgi:hypothetical protein